MVSPWHDQCVVVDRGAQRWFWDNGNPWHPCPLRGPCSMYQRSFVSCAQSSEDVLPGCAVNDVQGGFCVEFNVPDPIEFSVPKTFTCRAGTAAWLCPSAGQPGTTVEQCNRITSRDKGIMAERDNLQASLVVPSARHEWRITAPLHASSRACRRLVYRALRPFAHWAKPMLLRLAQKPVARKWVIRVLGRHSRLVNTARLFLIGAPMSSPPIETPPSPEMLAEGESLSARGRQVLSMLAEMRTQAKGETQHASRT